VAVRVFFGGGARACALFCLNDRIAFGVYQAAAEAGLTVPDDVSVVSFDDSHLASWLRPALTSVAIPHFELGRTAVELLLADVPAHDVHPVPMPVRERGSVAPPRPARASGHAGADIHSG
jgi:LacI family transcriptional regulator